MNAQGRGQVPWDEKIEKAYVQLAREVARWKQANPEAEVGVMSVGYSRGAVLAPGFSGSIGP